MRERYIPPFPPLHPDHNPLPGMLLMFGVGIVTGLVFLYLLGGAS